jgi:hypothetical protein
MSGEVEAYQAELDLKALEGFREGNQDLERLEALLDAHHLLRLRGRGVEACLRRGGDRDLHARRLLSGVCRSSIGPSSEVSDGTVITIVNVSSRC